MHAVKICTIEEKDSEISVPGRTQGACAVLTLQGVHSPDRSLAYCPDHHDPCQQQLVARLGSHLPVQNMDCQAQVGQRGDDNDDDYGDDDDEG